MKLDIEFVRQQFNQLNDDPDFVFCANAGGSYVANQVNQILNQYNAHTRVQPYERYATSTAAGNAMDRAINGWAAALNISADELTIGPSTSINTYVMAQAIGSQLNEGDEIIVTNQDHEANNGVWRRKAQQKNVTLREWRVDTQDGLLNPETLGSLLSEKTRWVFFTHCSNITGTSNPVQTITRQIKAYNPGIKVFIDAVGYAPHRICDMESLGVNGYVFSLYKVFGPHQSLMYIDQETINTLPPQCHFFNTGSPGKLFNPTGPQHAQVAGCAGVLDYFEALYHHHYGMQNKVQDGSTTIAQIMERIGALIFNHENQLTKPILDYLDNNKYARLIGKAHTNDGDRAPTIAFKPLRASARSVSAKIQDRGIGCESGHFYAWRLISDLGIDPEDGVVRISLVHYSSHEEVQKVLVALDSALQR